MQVALAHVRHGCRAEAGEASAAGTPRAWIDDAERVLLEQFSCQLLRGDIGASIEAVLSSKAAYQAPRYGVEKRAPKG